MSFPKDLLTVRMKLSLSVASLSLLFLSSVLLSSCNDAPELESVNTLGTDVQFSMAEYFEPGQRTLSFKFLTQKDFPCINYRIKSEHQLEGHEIRIRLTEVEGADVCLEAIAPASTFLDLGELNHGKYPITIEVGEALVNTGTLTVTEDDFALLMNEEDGLIIQTPRLRRIPTGVIWGRVQATERTMTPGVAQHFAERLQRVGALPRTLAEGDYGYFAVDPSGTITLPAAPNESFFLLDYRGELSQLESSMQEIRETYGDEVSVSLRTADGDELKSWALR